ncbi:MAG: hypothetical protein J6S24_09695 [Lentisphaeria bacterium]|nr:hypothetical protein [Lentisphaeria bacterium]
MKKAIYLIAIAAAGLLAGCTGIAKFDYATAPGTMVVLQEKGIATKSVAVLPFLDQRATKYYDPAQSHKAMTNPPGNHGSFVFGLIPLMPFGWVEKEEPEHSRDFVTMGRFHANFPQDLAAASMLSLKASNLFKTVTKANSIQQANADYVWRGTINSTYYRGFMYSYLITYFFSPALWLVGAPYGTSQNELWVKFELVQRATGAVVWSYEYRGDDYMTHWIYARVCKDANMYAALMKEAMNGALYNLQQRVPNL